MTEIYKIAGVFVEITIVADPYKIEANGAMLATFTLRVGEFSSGGKIIQDTEQDCIDFRFTSSCAPEITTQLESEHLVDISVLAHFYYTTVGKRHTNALFAAKPAVFNEITINGVTIEVGLCEEGEHADRNYLADFYVDTEAFSGSGYIEQNIHSGNPDVIFSGDFTVEDELALYAHFNDSAEEFEEALVGHYNNLVAQARKK